MGGFRFFVMVGAAILTACSSKPKTELPADKEHIQDAVSSHVGDVSDCYTAALKRNYKLSGKLLMEWEINPIGDVKNAKVIQGVEKKLDKCMVEKVSGWAFEPPPDGKIAKVHYPFVFAPADPLAGVKSKSFETVATPPPSNVKKCPQIESEYAQLCVRDTDSGECVLDEKQMGEMLQLMRASPKFEMSYLAELDRKLKNPKPSSKEIQELFAQLGEDCWSEIHQRMWKSIFHTFRAVPAHSRKSEAKEVLGSRTTNLEVPSPTLLGLSQDVSVLVKAVEEKFIQPGSAAKKDLFYIRNRVKNLRVAFNRDWGLKEGQSIPPPTADDGGKLILLVRKELKAVKPIRAQLKEWSRKYWRKL